eukprot:1179278-Prorocentrum_minimum.AAC.4
MASVPYMMVLCLLPVCIASRDIEGLLKSSRQQPTAITGDVLASMLGEVLSDWFVALAFVLSIVERACSRRCHA